MKVSIAMCTFNGARFLPEQLASLRAQQRRPDELIICDDASTDETPQLLKDFSRTAEFPVHLSVNSTNVGTNKNFAQAINACTGDIVFLCDQDDIWNSEKIRSIESIFQAHPKAGLVFTDAEFLDESSAGSAKCLSAELAFGRRRQNVVKTGGAFALLLRQNYVCGATMAFRSAFRELILPIVEDGPLIHDGWIALLISAVAGVSFIDRPLIKYRRHAAQQVGLARVSRVDEVMRAQRTAPDSYVRQARQLSEALSRLLDHGISARHEQPLREKIAHLHERARLPQSPLRRLPSVSKEIVNLRYHRFSRGWYSAAKDLLV